MLELDLPAVLTVVKEVADPRLPTLRGKQKAKTIEVPTLRPGDLEVDAEKIGLNGSPTRVVRIFRPKVTRRCEKVVAGDEQAVQDAAEKLLGFLRGKELI